MYYRIIKTFEVAASHCLNLDYPSKCKTPHGHNFMITVHCESEELDKNGMVIDFSEVKKKISSKIDHKHLNTLFDFNPTAENLAEWICDELGDKCYRVDVQESEGNVASYFRD